MGTPLIDNFAMLGRAYADKRQEVRDLESLRAIPETTVPDGFLCYCRQTRRWYQYDSGNAVDGTTGKWRVFNADITAISDAEMDALFEDAGL